MLIGTEQYRVVFIVCSKGLYKINTVNTLSIDTVGDNPGADGSDDDDGSGSEQNKYINVHSAKREEPINYGHTTKTSPPIRNTQTSRPWEFILFCLRKKVHQMVLTDKFKLGFKRESGEGVTHEIPVTSQGGYINQSSCCFLQFLSPKPLSFQLIQYLVATPHDLLRRIEFKAYSGRHFVDHLR